VRVLTLAAPIWCLPSQAAYGAALAAEFGLPPAAPLAPAHLAQAQHVLRQIPQLDEAARARLLDPAYWATAHAALRRLARAQYDETQAWLAARGLREAVLWRALVAPAPPGFRRGPVRLRALTFLSTVHPYVRWFAPCPPGVVLSATVPAARILTTFRTGTLTPHEAEVAILSGAADEAWQLAWDRPDAPEAAWTERDFCAAAEAVQAGMAPPVVAPPAADPWARYHPWAWWYNGDLQGAHSVDHSARVLVWANFVARKLETAGTRIDREVVRWAAVCHDCRREHDGDDPAHGERGAAWFGAHAATLAPALTPAQVAAVQATIRWHVPPDRACPRMTPELQCLKDADAVDRVRFGQGTPASFDARYLRLPYLHGRPHWALWLASRQGDPWGAVRAQAEQWNMWGDQVHARDGGASQPPTEPPPRRTAAPSAARR
jgi:uncharacterized protein